MLHLGCCFRAVRNQIDGGNSFFLLQDTQEVRRQLLFCPQCKDILGVVFRRIRGSEGTGAYIGADLCDQIIGGKKRLIGRDDEEVFSRKKRNIGSNQNDDADEKRGNDGELEVAGAYTQAFRDGKKKENGISGGFDRGAEADDG